MILTELIWPWPLTLGYFPKMGKTAKLMPSTGFRHDFEVLALIC